VSIGCKCQLNLIVGYSRREKKTGGKGKKGGEKKKEKGRKGQEKTVLE